MLTLGYGFVVFDGLDEISNLPQRRDAVHSIEAFCRRFPLARVVVTSRPEGYYGAPLDSLLFSAYHLPDFTEDQVRDYVHRWFKLTYNASGQGSVSVSDGFLRDSAVHASDLRTNPLMLSLLCMVYRYVGYIPENRPRIYEECTELLFERWDNIRHVRRDIEPDNKGRYLVQELAYYFFKHQTTQSGIEEAKLLLVLQEYLRRNVTSDIEAARSRAREFLDYCAGRAWVLTMIGTSPKGDRVFAFSHRTFMEYFVACYLVRQHSNVRDFAQALREYIIQGSSDVIPQIAIQRYDERHADGVDDCLSVLLFDSASVISKVECRHLPFVIRCTQTMYPSPRTMEKVFFASIRCYLASRELSLFSALNVGGTDHATTLELFARKVIDGDLQNKDTSIATRVGCCLLLIAQGDVRFDALTSEICESLIPDLGKCRRYFPDALTVMVKNKRLSLDDLSAACSAEQLIRTVRFMNMKTIREDGALIQELKSLFGELGRLSHSASGLSPSDLASVADKFGSGSMLSDLLEFLFSSPGPALPMAPGTMIEMLDIVENSGVDALGIINAVLDECNGFRPFIVTLILGGCELDNSLRTPLIDLGDGRLKMSYLWKIQESRDLGEDVDRGTLMHLRKFGLTQPWLDFVRSWARGEYSILIDDDP
jgi:hypothetical protein